MSRRVDWASRALREFDRLDENLQQRIVAAVDRLASIGHGDVRRLQGTDAQLYRLRVGDWRVIFGYQDDDGILILRVRPRGSAYLP